MVLPIPLFVPRSPGRRPPQCPSTGKALSVSNVADTQGHQITATQLAVDSKVEKRKVTDSGRQLQTNPDSPDLLQLEGAFLADDLALVPGRGGRRG